MSLRSAVAIIGALATCSCFPASWGANAIVLPYRRPLSAEPALAHRTVEFRTEDGLRLEGWYFPTPRTPRGLIVYLHGIGDNRQSGVGVASRFGPQGYDVFAYDSRAHGRSEGRHCTYGVYEKRDVGRALDAIGASEAILFGSSLGAAVALETAALDPRVKAVIAQSAFCDLERIVRDRAPFIASDADIRGALRLAGQQAHFSSADASAERSAGRIRVPVLLIHGANDDETPAEHSRRLERALAGPRQLLIVPGAGHNDVLASEDVWRQIGWFIHGLQRES